MNDDSTPLETLADRVRLAIESAGLKGLSGRRLALKFGLSEGHVNMILRGLRVEVSDDTARKIASATGVDWAWLKSGEGSAPRTSGRWRDVPGWREAAAEAVVANPGWSSLWDAFGNDVESMSAPPNVAATRHVVEDLLRAVANARDAAGAEPPRSAATAIAAKAAAGMPPEPPGGAAARIRALKTRAKPPRAR